MAGDVPGPPPDGHRLASALRGPGEGPEPRLDLGAVPGRLALGVLGGLPLDRGPPHRPLGGRPPQRLGPRAHRPRASPRRLLPLRGGLGNRPARPLLRGQPPARGPARERGRRGQLPDRQQEPGGDPGPLRRGRLPDRRLLRPRECPDPAPRAPPPARFRGDGHRRRRASRPLAARADRRGGQPPRARRVRPRRPAEAGLRQLRGEAPARDRGRGRHEQRDPQDLPVREPQGAEGPGPPLPDRQARGEPRHHGGQPDRGLGPRARPSLRVQARQDLPHRPEGLRDAAPRRAVRHQHVPHQPAARPCHQRLLAPRGREDPVLLRLRVQERRDRGGQAVRGRGGPAPATSTAGSPTVSRRRARSTSSARRSTSSGGTASRRGSGRTSWRPCRPASRPASRRTSG